MPNLVRESAVLEYKFCPVCELCSFTMHLAFHSPRPHIVSLQSHVLIFWTNSSWVAREYLFYDVVCRFCLILALSFKNMETEWPYQKINAINWLSILKYPYEYQCLFIIWGKNIGTWKLLHSHNFGHVTWKLWVGLPVEFISLVVL